MTTDTIRCYFEGLKGVVRYQPSEHGTDAKGREWSSPDGWIMTCESCGNSGPKRDDCSDAIDDWHQHIQGHPR